MKRFHINQVYDEKYELKNKTATFGGEITSKILDEFLTNRNSSNSSILEYETTNLSSTNNINNVDEATFDNFHSLLSANIRNNSYIEEDFNYWNDDNDLDDVDENRGGYSISNNEGCNSPSHKVATISNRKSILNLTIPSYSIVTLTKHLTKLSIHGEILKSDDQAKLMKGNNVTKGSFSRKLNHWYQKNNVPKAERNVLMNILYNSFGPTVNLPVRVLDENEKKTKVISLFQYGMRMKKFENELHDDAILSDDDDDDDCLIKTLLRNLNGSDDSDSSSSSSRSSSSEDQNSVATNELDDCNVQSLMASYDRKTARFVQIDQCLNDCFVYAGDNGNLFECPSCKELRFRPCCRALCEGRGKSVCEHLKTNDGVAYKQLHYRPLLILIADLLKTSYFITALRFQYKKHDPELTKVTYMDFMDGEVPIENLDSMNANFLNWQRKHDDRIDAVSVPLLLSQFYDGGQLFKSKTSNFWTLMTQILNLPPTYRGKLGIGMFIQAIYAGKHKMSESFLFIDNFCEELNLLYNGVELTISGVLYFIQARLVLHTMDTRAAEAILALQSTSNSRAGCPLDGSITGIHDGNKCVYIGHRHLLPMNNYLRYLGQSGACCPTDFYDPVKPTRHLWMNEEFVNSNSKAKSLSVEDTTSVQKFYKLVETEEKGQKLKDSNSARKRTKEQIESISRKKVFRDADWQANEMDFCKPCDAPDNLRITAMQSFLFEKNDHYQWSHKEPEFNFGDSIIDKEKGLRKYLFYRHFDFREFKPHKRISYEQHLKAAEEARNLNAAARKLKAKKNEKTDIQKYHHINGIQDVWYFDRLIYADISRQFTWPLVHAITGIVKLLSGIILGCAPGGESSGGELGESSFNSKTQPSTKSTIIKENEEEEDEENDEHEYGGYEACDNAHGSIKVVLSRKEKNNLFNSYRPNFSGGLKEPFEASKADISRCREWLRCILLPPGLNEDSYNIKGFVQHNGKLGYMKMSQRLRLISSFWEIVILSMKSLADQYKLYFRMFGNDISKLLSCNINHHYVAQIKADIIETISLWEGLLPTRHCRFQLHELLDLADFIPLFGPPIGVNELPGERAMGRMINRKLKSNTGGVSFEKTIMQNQIDYELQTMKKFYKDAISVKRTRGKSVPNSELYCQMDSTNQSLLFNSIPFDIFDSEKVSRFFEFEINSLVEVLILEVKKLYDFDDDLCKQKSSIYRIECIRHSKYRHLTIFQWLNYICNPENIIDKEFEENFIDEDLDVAVKLLHFEAQFYQYAYIYGVEFASRGSCLRETKISRIGRYGDQKKLLAGSLQNDWNEGSNYGSWCTFEQYNKKNTYGQINAFFRITMLEPSVDGLILASVTSRKHSVYPKSSVHCISSSGSLNNDILFVATTDIFPSRIATLPFNSQNKVISLVRKNVDAMYATSETSDLTYVFMIILNPEKLATRPINRPYKLYQI